MAKLIDSIFPGKDWYVTDSFGPRIHPISKNYSYHYGTDYGTHLKKWAQYAIEDGYITSTGSGGGYGKYVWVRYPRIGKALLHAHLDSIKVKKGQKVKKGTILGYTGTTGNSTGIHLHLGMQPIGKSKWENPHTYNYAPPLSVTSTVAKTVNKNQVKVLISNLNVRKEPSLLATSLGMAKKDGYYNYYEVKTGGGYTWYRISDNQWIADNGKYLVVYKKITPVNVSTRDTKKPQIQVNISDLNIRVGVGVSYEGLSSYCVKGGIYDYFEIKTSGGYTWYRIGENQWIANNGKYLTVYAVLYLVNFTAKRDGSYRIYLKEGETLYVRSEDKTLLTFVPEKAATYRISLSKGERLLVG